MDYRSAIAQGPALSQVNADALVLVLAPEHSAVANPELDRLVKEALDSGDFALKAGRALYLHRPAGVKAPRLVLVAGASKRDALAAWLRHDGSVPVDRVRRTGTAGVLPAPQIIDPLATDPDMTRARGLAALAASGPQTRVTLRLPVLQETGLILPGTLLDYAAEGATRRGIVRSFQADWTHPELWQSVEVECHG